MRAYLYPNLQVPVRTMPIIRLRAKCVRDTLKRQLHDAGRQGSGFGHERNDCTVRATATACGIPYAEAHEILALAGRKPGRGIVFSHEAKNKRFEGYDMQPVPTVQHVASYGRDRYMTVAKALKGPLRRGKFIALTVDHAFAVINGVVHDTGTKAVRARTRVVGAFIPVKIKMLGDKP